MEIAVFSWFFGLFEASKPLANNSDEMQELQGICVHTPFERSTYSQQLKQSTVPKLPSQEWFGSLKCSS